MRFEALNLDQKLIDAVHAMGYEKCTPVQEQALPECLTGQDVMAQAQTGTGKTAVFLLTILQRMIADNDPGGSLRALIVVPTRELAVQVEEQAVLLCKFLHYRSISIYGGVGYDEQERALAAGAEIVVGTPGRMIDFIKSGKLKLGTLSFFVIDEADRMFDMGFTEDVKYILSRAPDKEKRQTIMVSATLDDRVRHVAYQYMREAVEVEIEPDQITVEKVTQHLFHVSLEEKIPLLLTLLRRENMERAIIFCNMKRTVEDVGYKLAGNGIKAEVLTGDVDQKKRLKIIERMKNGEVHVLVATDVAARGLHIDNISHVINFDIPADAPNYVHRIGRTARAGATGVAYTIACERHVENLPAIERYIDMKIDVAPMDFELTEDEAGNRPRGRRPDTRGGRPGGGRGDAPRGGRDRHPGGGRGEGRGERKFPPARDGRGGPRPETRGPAPKPKKEMSSEERMELYRRKYGDSFGGKAPEPGTVADHGSRHAGERKAGGDRKPGEFPKGRRNRGKGPRHGKPHGQEHGTKPGHAEHKPAAHKPAHKVAHKPTHKAAEHGKKKGIISKIFGIFKKKK